MYLLHLHIYTYTYINKQQEQLAFSKQGRVKMDILHVEQCVGTLLCIPLSNATEENICTLRALLAETNTLLLNKHCLVLSNIRDLLESRLSCENTNKIHIKQKRRIPITSAIYTGLRSPNKEEWQRLLKQKIHDVECSSGVGQKLDYTKVLYIYYIQQYKNYIHLT